MAFGKKEEEVFSPAPEPVAEVQVNVEESDVVPPVSEPEQVKPTTAIFVPQEDFEGRINQTDFQFKKGVAVKVTLDEANVWVAAEKGYVK